MKVQTVTKREALHTLWASVVAGFPADTPAHVVASLWVSFLREADEDMAAVFVMSQSGPNTTAVSLQPGIAAAFAQLARELRHAPAPSRIGRVEPLGDDDMTTEVEAHEIAGSQRR